MATFIQSSQSLNPLTSHHYYTSSKFQSQPSSSFFNSPNTQRVQPISVSLSSSLLFYGERSRNMKKMALASSKGQYIREDYLVKKVSAKDVEEMVKGERSVPLIVDFYATWCGPCILMAQELEMLAVEYENNAQFVKVDTDDEYEFARDMQVRGLPTLYFISPDPSKDAIRTEGLIPTDMIKNIIDNEM